MDPKWNKTFTSNNYTITSYQKNAHNTIITTICICSQLLTILFLAISSYVKKEKIFSTATSGRSKILKVAAISKHFTPITFPHSSPCLFILSTVDSRFSDKPNTSREYQYSLTIDNMPCVKNAKPHNTKQLDVANCCAVDNCSSR